MGNRSLIFIIIWVAYLLIRRQVSSLAITYHGDCICYLPDRELKKKGNSYQE